MVGECDVKDSTILSADDREFLEELSEYLEVLGNSARLRIIRLLEKEPMDAGTLSHRTKISYENTKKHLAKLLGAGLVTRMPGLGRETSKGVHPAWIYLPVPGVLERIQRDLGVISSMPVGMSAEAIGERIASVRLQIGRELCAERWMLLVLGGEWDGRVIPLVQPKTELGRGREGGITREGNTTRVAFPQSYRSVTRLEKPHSVVRIHGDKCAIEDTGSRGGTFLNGKRVVPLEQIGLRDGDRVMLSRGDFSVTLVFLEGSAHGDRST